MAEHSDNEIVVDSPPQLTFQIANDLSCWPQLFAGEYSTVEVMREDCDRVIFRLTTEPDEHGRIFSWVSERCPDPANRSVTARRLELGPFHYMHIFQSVTLVDGHRSKLRWVQDFELRPDAPITESQMKERINKGSVASLLRHKQVIEEAAARSEWSTA